MKGKLLRKLSAVSLSAMMVVATGVTNIVPAVTAGLSVSAATTADSKFKYEVNEDGGVTITKYTGNDTEVVIPSKIGGKKVTSIGYRAFDECLSLTSVTIPDSVTSIGEWAFYRCSRLTFVTIPDSVTSIGDEAFYKCSSLTSVTIPDSVTSIGYGAFWNCTSLTSVTISDSVTSIGDKAFSECKSLTSVTIPDSVTSIGDEAFYYCKTLTSITIPDSVTSIGDTAFYYCSSLTSVTIPDSVTSIKDGTFWNCTSLTSVTIPDSVTSIGSSAFCACQSLTSVTIPDSVTSIGDEAFFWCTRLTSITIPDGVTSIGYGAFWNCTSLTSVTIPDSVTSIGDSAFKECTSLTSVTIPDSVTSIGDYEFSGCSSLTSVTIPDSVTSIGSSAFEDCSSLTSVTIPDSVTDINYAAFNTYPTFFCKANSYAQRFADRTLKNPFVAISTDNYSVFGSKFTLGDNITVNWSSEGTSNKKQFRILYQKAGETNWKTLSDYSTSGTVTFTPTKAGDYTIRIKAKDAIGQVDTKDLTVSVVDKLKNSSSVNKKTMTIGMDNGIAITCSASGGLGEKQFHVLYQKSGETNWKTLSDYSTAETVTFTPTTAGDYTIRIKVKDAQGTVDTKDLTVSVVVPKLENISSASKTEMTIGIDNGIAITCSASGGLGEKQFHVLYQKSGETNWKTLSDYSTAGTVTFTPKTAGDYTIRIKAKDAIGQVDTKDLTVSVVDKLENTSSVNKTTMTIGKDNGITVTCSAQGGVGEKQFRVLYQKAGESSWKTLSDYSTSGAVTFAPTIAGDYTFRIKAKDAKGTVDTKDLTVSVEVPKLKNTSSVNKTAMTIGKDNGITVTCSAQGGVGEKQFRVLYQKAGESSWKTLSDYSTSGTVTFTPKTAGDYTLRIKAKDAKGTVDTKDLTVSVEVPKLENTSSVNKTAMTIGKDNGITVTCSAQGGVGEKQFRVLYQKAGETNWKTLSDYSTAKTVTFTPKTAGDYTICIKAKDAKGTVDTKDLTVSVTVDKLENTSSVNKTAMTIGKDNGITVTCSAQGGVGEKQYRILYQRVGESSWKTLSDYSTNSFVSFDPKKPGDYIVRVKAKDQTGQIASKDLTVTVSGSNALEGHTVGIVGSFNNWMNDVPMYDNDGDGVWEGDIVIENVTADMIGKQTTDKGIQGGVVETGKEGVCFRVRCDETWGTYWGDYEVAYSRTEGSQTNCCAECSVWDSVVIHVKLDTNSVDEQEGADPGDYIEAGSEDSIMVWPVTYTVKWSKPKGIDGCYYGETEDGWVVPHIRYIARGGKNPYTYAVYYRKVGAETWKTLQSYTAQKDVNMTVNLKSVGDYEIRIAAKDANGNVIRRDETVHIDNPFNNTSSISKTKMTLDEDDSIVVTCSATGGAGEKQFRVLYQKVGETNWKLLSDYSAAKAVTFAPTTAGDYTIRIKAKDAKGKVDTKELTVTVSDRFNYIVNQDGSVAITGYNGSEADLVIPDTIDGKKVTSLWQYAFEKCLNLTSVMIPDGVIRIGIDAFNGCSSLKDIYIPDSVENIQAGAFSGTAWYDNQPDGDVYAGKVYYAYKGTMPEGTSVVIKEGTKGIADMAFWHCEGLTNISIPNGVKNLGTSFIGRTFEGCSHLEEINMPDSIETLGEKTFIFCGLKKVKLSNGLKMIGAQAFADCYNLTEIIIPGSIELVGGQGYTSYEGAFNRCTNLKKVVISEGVKAIGAGAFAGCSSLEEIVFPHSLEKIATDDLQHASNSDPFGNCTNLKKATFLNDETIIGGWWGAGNIFSNCNSLTIYGNNGSTAETFADTYNIPFEVILPDNLS